jgi:hypothetical protein
MDRPFCVNGQPIVADAAYWVTTTARVANDDEVYQVMKSLSPDYRQVVQDFITGEIAATLRPTTVVRTPATIAAAETQQQMRPMWHLDIGKLVMTFRGPAARRGKHLRRCKLPGRDGFPGKRSLAATDEFPEPDPVQRRPAYAFDASVAAPQSQPVFSITSLHTTSRLIRRLYWLPRS